MITNLISDYHLLKELGVGSLGKTYLAEHRYLKRPFVLKLLPEELANDKEFVQRFEKEVLFLSKLEHPNIVKICDASFADGHYFLASEALLDSQGRSVNLAQYFAEKHYSLSEEEVLRIARQIASALDYVHGMKTDDDEALFHGCLKLNNIVIKEGKNGPLVVLTDLGLSRVIGPLAMLNRTYHSVAASLSADLGFTLGKNFEAYTAGPWNIAKATELQRSFCQTFAFLAPEQKITGHPQSNSIKSDIYAFGILLYFLLTAEFPEGYFELPFKKIPTLKWNWDLLICRAMQTDPVKRPEHLSAKIDELISSTTLSAVNIPMPKAKNSSPIDLEDSAKYALAAAPTLANVKDTTRVKPVLKPTEISRPAFEPDPGAIFQTETAVAPYKPHPKEDTETEPLLTEMAIIPAGSFLRGGNQGGRDEMPRHIVNLSAFALDVHPVTNEQFARFLEAMGGEKDSNNNDIIRLRESRIKRFAGKLTIESGYAKHPVVGVSWYGAVAYARWVGKRLPTEAEWEIASYGGREDFLFPTGNEIERTQANFFSSDTTPTVSYPPNGYGLYDMAGNVYEWCQDWYDYHFYDLSVQEPDNPKGPVQGVYRVLRGGCWKSSKEDLRCAHRHRNNPGLMNGTYGFRCAADVAIED